MQHQQEMSARGVRPRAEPFVVAVVHNLAVELAFAIVAEKLSRDAVAEAEPAVALDAVPVTSAGAGDVGRYLEVSFFERDDAAVLSIADHKGFARVGNRLARGGGRGPGREERFRDACVRRCVGAGRERSGFGYRSAGVFFISGLDVGDALGGARDVK